MGKQIDEAVLFRSLPVPRFAVLVEAEGFLRVAAANDCALGWFGRGIDDVKGHELGTLLEPGAGKLGTLPGQIAVNPVFLPLLNRQDNNIFFIIFYFSTHRQGSSYGSRGVATNTQPS